MKEKFKDTEGLDKAYMSLAKHYDEHKENAIRQVKDGTFVDLPNKETEELQKTNAIAEMAVYNLELTKEELDFIYDRCSRKAARLEESHLEDVPCYRLSWQIMSKIFSLRKSLGEAQR